MALYVAVTSRVYDGVTIYDVTDPASPSEVSTLTSPDLNAVSGVARIGDALFVHEEGDTSAVLVSVADPSAPTVVARLAAGFGCHWVLPHSDGAHFIAIYDGGEVRTFSFDLVAETLTEESELDTGLTDCRQGVLSASGDYLYVPGYTDNDLYVVDVSDPTSISLSSTLDLSAVVTGRPGGIGRIGDDLYIVERDGQQVVALDGSTEATPVVATSLGTVALSEWGQRVLPSLDGAYIYAWSKTGSSGAPVLDVIDVADPGAMSVVGSLTLVSVGFNDYVWEFDVGSDGMLYIPGGADDAFYVIDAVTDPTTPVIETTVSDATKLNDCENLVAWEVASGEEVTPGAISSLMTAVAPAVAAGAVAVAPNAAAEAMAGNDPVAAAANAAVADPASAPIVAIAPATSPGAVGVSPSAGDALMAALDAAAAAGDVATASPADAIMAALDPVASAGAAAASASPADALMAALDASAALGGAATFTAADALLVALAPSVTPSDQEATASPAEMDPTALSPFAWIVVPDGTLFAIDGEVYPVAYVRPLPRRVPHVERRYSGIVATSVVVAGDNDSEARSRGWTVRVVPVTLAEARALRSLLQSPGARVFDGFYISEPVRAYPSGSIRILPGRVDVLTAVEFEIRAQAR